MKRRKIFIFLWAYLLIMYSSFYASSASVYPINISPPRNTIRVVSYNIHFGISPMGKPSISEVSKFLSTVEADIICLQEVDKFSLRSLFTNQPEILNKNLSMQMVYKETSSILAGNTGNLILSRFPIITVENIKLPSSDYPRSALKIVVATPYGTMQVMNTHLGLSKNIRQKQMKILNEIISKDHVPTILAGDFNTSNHSEFKHLLSLLKDPAMIMKKDYMHTFNDSKNNSRIDYVLTPKNFRIKLYDVPKLSFSDHYPVVIDIKK